MAYSVKADIIDQLPEKRLAQLTDDDPVGAPAVDDDVVDAMIEKADNQINTYLRGKNILPIDTAETPRVKDWSVGLAIFNLYKRRVDLEIPEPVRVDHDDIMTELRAVRDNKILIDDPTSPANTGSIIKGSGSTKSTMFTSNDQGTGTLDQYYDGPC